MRMAVTLLLLDLVIVLWWGASVAVTAEEAALQVYQGSGNPPYPGMEVRESTDTPVGSRFILHWLPGQTAPEGTLRHLEFEPGWRTLRGDWEGYARYTITLPPDGNGTYTRILFDLGEPYRRFAYGMSILLIVEGIFLFFGFWGIRKSTRRTLAPIRELTEMAHSISSERQPRAKRQEDLKLSGTIDTLNTITAKRLDTRIQITGERAELQGLAGAINSMLDRLDEAYQSQLRFVSDASHELRTPIAVIQGYANLLDRWGKDDPAALQESIDAIKAEAQSMQALVEQLLFLARTDNNSIVLKLELLDITALTAEVLRDSQIIDGAHAFRPSIAPDLWAQGDIGLVKQALRIFVDNAIKYTPAGERITVSAAREGDWVKVAVSDNGIGIPEEDLPQVFDRFFRADESRTRKTGGTGLGLSIAKWIVHRHGGHLEILSRKDAGTRLTMLLPAAQTPAGEPTSASTEESY